MAEIPDREWNHGQKLARERGDDLADAPSFRAMASSTSWRLASTCCHARARSSARRASPPQTTEASLDAVHPRSLTGAPDPIDAAASDRRTCFGGAARARRGLARRDSAIRAWNCGELAHLEALQVRRGGDRHQSGDGTPASHHHERVTAAARSTPSELRADLDLRGRRRRARGPAGGPPRRPLMCRPIASCMRARVSSTVAPVATQPGKSGE